MDDGSVFATSPTLRSAASVVKSAVEEILHWLHRNGLRADKEKTEFMTISAPHAHESRIGPPLASITIDDPFVGPYEVRASEVVRYLGVFIDRRLNWEKHVKVLACRARSTVRVLQILGNSVRRISFSKWQKLFHAIILPILTYAAPVWWYKTRQKGLA